MRSANNKTFTCHRCLQSKLVYKVAVHLSTPDLKVLTTSEYLLEYHCLECIKLTMPTSPEVRLNNRFDTWQDQSVPSSWHLRWTAVDSYYFTMTYNLANCWLPHSLLQAAINCKWPTGQPREALLCFTSHQFQYSIESWACGLANLVTVWCATTC